MEVFTKEVAKRLLEQARIEHPRVEWSWIALDGCNGYVHVFEKQPTIDCGDEWSNYGTSEWTYVGQCEVDGDWEDACYSWDELQAVGHPTKKKEEVVVWYDSIEYTETMINEEPIEDLEGRINEMAEELKALRAMKKRWKKYNEKYWTSTK